MTPRWTTPSCTYSGMSLGRTSRRSTGALRTRDDERSLGRLEGEARVGAEPQRRLGHPALGRNGEREPAVFTCAREGAHRRFARGECDPVPTRSVLDPLCDAGHRRRRGRHALGDLEIREPARRVGGRYAIDGRALRALLWCRDRGGSVSPRRSFAGCGSRRRARRARRCGRRRRSAAPTAERSLRSLSVAMPNMVA